MGSSDVNLYEILGVRTDARIEVIQRAWRIAISENHPDRVAHLGAEREAEASRAAAELNHAAWILTDPDRRRRYDLEIGVRSAVCGMCGSPGRLRLGPEGSARGFCDPCYEKAGTRHARAHGAD